jgi:hypothetical protein
LIASEEHYKEEFRKFNGRVEEIHPGTRIPFPQLGKGRIKKDSTELKTMESTRTHFEALFRTKCPDLYANIVQAATGVATTHTDDNDDDDKAADESNATRSSSDTEINLWKHDIFGNMNNASQMAHLIPSVAVQASLYDDVVAWALGLTPEKLASLSNNNNPNRRLSSEDEAIWIAKQKMIHGVRPGEGYKRISCTGLKHSPYNKIRLMCQTYYLNNRPCVVIVPTLSLDQVKAWNGEGYSAIVMAEAWEGASMASVCSGICMIDFGPLANNEEMELARTLLEQVLCGLAFSLFRDRPFLPEKSAALLSELRSNFSNTAGKVSVPCHVNGGPVVLRVRKVTFGHEEGQHLPPDPLLLAVRAAVVWSKRNGEQLLPNGEEPEDEDSEYEDDDTSIREFERNIDELKTYFPHSWRFMR